MKRKLFDANEHESSLYENGYCIYDNSFSIDDIKMNRLINIIPKTMPIFNTNYSDKRRSQTKIKPIESIYNFLDLNFPNHIKNEWNLLHSKPSCKVQMAHCDYVIPEMFLPNDLTENCPLSAIASLMDNTQIRLWPNSHRLVNFGYEVNIPIKPVDFVLDAGSIIVFRGDLVHAGSAYKDENIRIHVYLDHKAVPRTPNRTWIIRKDANDYIKKNIIE